MKLKCFKVMNFRSLKNTEWIKVHDFTAFIGENDGGKTASTNILSLLFSNIRPEESDYTWNTQEDSSICRCEEVIIEAKLITTKKEELNIVQSFLSQEDELYIKRTWYQDGRERFVIIGQVPSAEDFRGNWQLDTVALLKGLCTRNCIDITGVNLKADIIAKIQEWLSTQPTVQGEMDITTEIKNILPRVEVFSSSKSIDPEKVVNNVLRTLCNSEIASDKYSGQISEIESGITEVLATKVDEITPFIKKYYQEVERVAIEPKFSISSGLSQVPLVLLEENGAPIQLSKKGDGKRRQVTLGVFEWSTEALANRAGLNQDIILILDEPDTHMDYATQRKLFGIISKYIELDIQVIICTHSINLINRMQVSKINHFKLNNDGYSVIESLNMPDEDTETLFINEIGLNLGLDNGTMFHERCFIVVEGPTEMHVLPQLFRLIYKKSMQSCGIKLLNGENNGGVRNFAKFLNKNNRHVVFLLDNDCNTGPSKNIFSKESLVRDGFDLTRQVFFIGNEELEDAFSNEVLTVAGNKKFPKESGVWEEDDFEILRINGKKFSFELQALFRAGKPEIGYAIGQVIDDINKIPESIKNIFYLAYEMANSH